MSRRGIVGLLLVAAAAAAAGVGGWWLRGGAGGGVAQEAPVRTVRYHCPMHPAVVSDQPGECPICHMSLVPIDDEQEGEEEPQSTPAVPGLAEVRVPPRRQQLIGVKTAVVTRAPFRREIRAVGRVAFDETRLRHIHTKISGYVETLHANATGQPVRQGQPLLEIYSPELLASQQEFLIALQARSRTAGSSIPSVASTGEELVASARRRLQLLDFTEEQIREIETSGRARRTVTLHAPLSGTVIERKVTQGERVDPERTLLDLVDLSRVWVLASVYEYELPFVREGQRASMTLSYVPGRTFAGRVALIYPALDAATRTAQVRLEFANPDLVLRPEMFAEVRLEADLGERIAVPASAVLETGARSVVFVQRGEGHFEPREISVGLRLPDVYEVVSGLGAGETVVASGNFFIDSESRLKSALAAAAEGPAQPAHAHPEP